MLRVGHEVADRLDQASGSVARKPETPDSIAVTISVVARPTIGRPTIIASITARPRLV